MRGLTIQNVNASSRRQQVHKRPRPPYSPDIAPNNFKLSGILLPQGVFRMIRDSDFADHETFQKGTRETFERYGFLKRVLVSIG
jgi:hypothetical protein